MYFVFCLCGIILRVTIQGSSEDVTKNNSPTSRIDRNCEDILSGENSARDG